MKLKIIDCEFSVCKVTDYSDVDMSVPFVFTGSTDEERSPVCPSSCVPANVTDRNDGWRGFRIEGVLDFSLVGILSRIASLLAENGIGLFAVSTFNTDYIFTKSCDLGKALDVLRSAGYETA